MRAEVQAALCLGAVVLSGCSSKGAGPSPGPSPGPAPVGTKCAEVFSACASVPNEDCYVGAGDDASKFPDCNEALLAVLSDFTTKKSTQDFEGMNEYIVGGLAGQGLFKETCLTGLRYMHTSKTQVCPMPQPPALHDIEVPDDSFTLFALGDWGPTGNNHGCPWQAQGCPEQCRMTMFDNVARIADSCTKLFDTNNNAQQNVADQMALLAQKTPPAAVINVGDNFYFGGLSTPWNRASGVSTDITMDYTLNASFTEVYLKNKNDKAGKLRVPWLGMLGNHDYGGAGCFADWQVQLEFTEMDPTGSWTMPWQYYQQRIRAKGYTVDIFVNEINHDDCCTTDEHGVCHQKLCGSSDYPTGHKADPAICMDRFGATRDRNLEWLEQALNRSKAAGVEWQIVAGHFSDGQNLLQVKELMQKYGAHLYVGGHTHKQTLLRASDPGAQGVPSVVTGAGGGIEFEGENDYYGFVAIDVSKDKLTVKMLSDKGETRDSQEFPRKKAVETVV